MNINCSQIDNFNNSLEYFNSTKFVCDDLIKYIRTYKQLIIDFSKKLTNMQSNFSKKLSKTENSKLNQIIILTNNLITLFDENISLYKLSIDELELRVKTFENDLKAKLDSVKVIQKKTLEQNKILTNCYYEINKAKKNYLDSMTKTEEIINKYYSDKKILDEHDIGLDKKLNVNEYNILKEKLKIELNDMNNNIKVSKNLEINYKDLITASDKIYTSFVENYNKYYTIIKDYTVDLSEKIKSLVMSFLITFKNCYKQPLVSTDIDMNILKEIHEGKEVEKIIIGLYKDDNLLQKVTPINYQLKSFEILKENNFFDSPEMNINSFMEDSEDERKSSKKPKYISKFEDGFSQLQYISDSALFNTIKTIFDNFKFIEKGELNLELEEIKFKTQEYIFKIESNMNSYPYAKYGKKKTDKNDIIIMYKRNELTKEDKEALTKLLDHHESRLILLQKLSDYRARGNFYLDQVDYNLLLHYFNLIADKVKDNLDYHCGEMIIIISQTYFMEKNDKKIYIQDELRKNKLFKDKSFWEEFLCYAINKEIMKTQRRDKKIKENKKSTDNKLSNVVFSQLLTLIDNMAEFGLDAQSIKDVIEPKIFYYKLNDTLKNTINDVLNAKIEGEKEKMKQIEEDKKKEELNDNNNKKEDINIININDINNEVKKDDKINKDIKINDKKEEKRDDIKEEEIIKEEIKKEEKEIKNEENKEEEKKDG